MAEITVGPENRMGIPDGNARDNRNVPMLPMAIPMNVTRMICNNTLNATTPLGLPIALRTPI
jgi:hypothetical protein